MVADAFIPAFGPRLLTAKAVFGNIMRRCHKEILEYTKTLPPQKVAKSSLLYTKLHLPIEYGHAGEKVLVCLFKVLESTGAGIQLLDDTIAVGRRAVLTFGWT
ncbi:uncharacterized protein LOC142564918 isoform X2 [Dermacentor variabilis]|uniref:uncharacterized protein LOC142564918 isoform X2 n=1 Tax=Dermacentor variabilis TaxID=34621 RepID=UPI003F5BF1B7